MLYFLNIDTRISGYFIGRTHNDFVGIYIHPNTAGLVAALSFIISLLSKDIMNNKFLTVNKIIQIIIMILAHSNASLLISIMFVILKYSYLTKCNKHNNLNSYIFIPSIFEFFANGRFELWYIGLLVIFNNPILGVSPANTINAGIKYGQITGYSAINNGGFHNSFIELFAAVGLIGGILIIYYIFKKIKDNLNKKQKSMQ